MMRPIFDRVVMATDLSPGLGPDRGLRGRTPAIGVFRRHPDLRYHPEFLRRARRK